MAATAFKQYEFSGLRQVKITYKAPNAATVTIDGPVIAADGLQTSYSANEMTLNTSVGDVTLPTGINASPASITFIPHNVDDLLLIYPSASGGTGKFLMKATQCVPLEADIDYLKVCPNADGRTGPNFHFKGAIVTMAFDFQVARDDPGTVQMTFYPTPQPASVYGGSTSSNDYVYHMIDYTAASGGGGSD